ncbi:phosphopentomutase [Desulfofalx alkaliphila]|uniref:phosphopentomutase n=1 Tax=Desulfofalx alkaliphila TaxID=105483 RepID=UPI0004E19BC6|nr:phosphopentomutase [Desulfofalx alkaliphila]
MSNYGINRITLIILDSVGIGELPDAHEYGDEGSNTLVNVAKAVGGLNLPNMAKIGLGNILEIPGVAPEPSPIGGYGKMNERSPGKDTTTGHWELAGIILDRPFPVFPNGFPTELIEEYQRRIGRKVLGNKAASGTAIIEELGQQHMQTGSPIVYTSADSVFQVAAHENVIQLDELYRICEIAREMLTGDYAVGRVIARPFVGQPGKFKRTANRHDYSLPPVKPTVLDRLVEKNINVWAVGKIEDIFAGRGITKSMRTKSNVEGINTTIECLRQNERGIIFTNLVEYDQNYGHRKDPQGYAKALEEFDQRLPEIMATLKNDDLLIITADHGCDPTTAGTDHSREYVPLLVYSPQAQKGIDLGVRTTFADVAATIADLFNLNAEVGVSFAAEVLERDK